jgi:DNA-binding GntR family transcriptional regulator
MTQGNSSSLHLYQIDNKSRRERVLEALREAIVTGELKPGQALIEVDLAAQLGVSRAPLREALQNLSHEGLVETVPYKGSIVRRLTRRDIEELYSLRSVLEIFAIQRIIAQNNTQNVAALRHVFDMMLEAAQRGDLKEVNRIDRQFHDVLIDLSQHHLLVQTWASVTMRVSQVMALTNRRNTDIAQIAYNHLPIIEAIADGNEAQAILLISQHVASSGGLIVEDWDDLDMDGGE